MSFEKDQDPFLEDFLLKTVSRIIYLFREDCFFGAEASAGSDEIIDSSLQGDGNFEEIRCFEEVRWSNVTLEHE